MSLLSSVLGNPGVQRFLWRGFRSFAPFAKFGKNVFISRYDDVVDVLKRDQEFTISEINAERMNGVYLPFFLGMDRSEQHDKELGLMQQVVKREDLGIIQNIVRQKAAELIDKVRSNKQIDVVNEYARIVPMYFNQDYFGVPVHNEEIMKRWMRILFHHLFLNLNNDAQIKQKADIAAGELKIYMESLIAARKQELAANGSLPDNVLNRLLLLQKDQPWITDDLIRRNVCGFIIGAVDTTNTSTNFAMSVLLHKKEQLKGARQAAVNNDIPLVGKYMLEALRFKPHNPIVLRYSKKDTVVNSRGSKSHTIPAGSTVYVGITSAMFDRKIYPNPMHIDIARKADYLHFSYGLHACAGRYINMVQIPELMAGLLRLEGLRKAGGSEGKIKYEGPFPDRFILQFN